MKIKMEFKPGEEDAAEHFLSWLCGQGEQDYWMWMEYREQESDGPITVLSFDYDWTKLEAKCELGRLDEEEE